MKSLHASCIHSWICCQRSKKIVIQEQFLNLSQGAISMIFDTVYSCSAKNLATMKCDTTGTCGISVITKCDDFLTLKQTAD
jgi:hypothetical protein